MTYHPARPPHDPRAGMPDKQIPWVVLAFVLFLPLGVVAFFEMQKIEECWRRGDWAGAQRASRDTRKWGQWGLWIGAAVWAALCLLFVVVPVVFLGGTAGCAFCSVCGFGAATAPALAMSGLFPTAQHDQPPATSVERAWTSGDSGETIDPPHEMKEK